MVVVKSGHGLLGHEALKSALSQKWIDEMSWFFAGWYKFGTAKSYFNNYWVGMVKNGWGLIDMGLWNQVYLTNHLTNWADWLNGFCMLIVME